MQRACGRDGSLESDPYYGDGQIHEIRAEVNKEAEEAFVGSISIDNEQRFRPRQEDTHLCWSRKQQCCDARTLAATPKNK
uniref:Uncharacterized protein n=1 Tax=Romanomermis culicivorax TaxID=13658 RepID=A0A915HLH5_ROMCU